MKIKELIKELQQWPEDAQVELAIPVDLHSIHPVMEDKIWLELKMVEEPNPDTRDSNNHCLLFGGKITME